ncbi:MAG: UDP-glucose 6-dehydrogenase AglM [Methanosaeta sp. PtaU1.Bin112]|nr:MAG: UDP-glucose 6-dehydrogenase AglM [Methanosaeta sp. PtaU1.Bin112]
MHTRISVVGGGYVGLVSAACFSQLGHIVNLIEIDPTKVQAINQGRPPIYENGLEEILLAHVGKNLTATSSYESIPDSEVVLICVGTPQAQDGGADLSMISSAARSIGIALQRSDGYHVVAVKSTVPPGTTEHLVRPTVMKCSEKDANAIGFVMNPEFLREGLAVQDFMKPDRIVIGSSDQMAGDRFEGIYSGLEAPLIRTSLTAAEMIKYTSNAFLSTKISFSNEIGNICKRLGIDVYEVMKGVGLDHRINPYFLNAGAGFGGSCFPKDVSALIHLAKNVGEDPALLNAVVEINDKQPMRMIELLEKRVGNLQGKKIAVIGLAFKNDTDDARESRAIPVIIELIQRGAKVAAYDPQANSSMSKIVPEISYCANPSDALEMADACLVMTEWPEFSYLDREFDLMKRKVIIEGRRILSCKDAEGICW